MADDVVQRGIAQIQLDRIGLNRICSERLGCPAQHLRPQPGIAHIRINLRGRLTCLDRRGTRRRQTRDLYIGTALLHL